MRYDFMFITIFKTRARLASWTLRYKYSENIKLSILLLLKKEKICGTSFRKKYVAEKVNENFR